MTWVSTILGVILFASSMRLLAVEQTGVEQRFKVIGVIGGDGSERSVVVLKDTESLKSFSLKEGQALPKYPSAILQKIHSQYVEVELPGKKLVKISKSTGRPVKEGVSDPIKVLPNSGLDQYTQAKQKTKDENKNYQLFEPIDLRKEKVSITMDTTADDLDQVWSDLTSDNTWDFVDLDPDSKAEIRRLSKEIIEAESQRESLEESVQSWD